MGWQKAEDEYRNSMSGFRANLSKLEEETLKGLYGALVLCYVLIYFADWFVINSYVLLTATCHRYRISAISGS